MNQLRASNDYTANDRKNYDNPLDDWVCEIRSETEGLIALAVGGDDSQAEFRARLIASSPKLLSTLIMCRDRLSEYDDAKNGIALECANRIIEEVTK